MTEVRIYGAVIANGKLYEDNEIANLILDGGLRVNCGEYYNQCNFMRRHTNLRKVGWSYAGTQTEEESNILIVVDNGINQRDHLFNGKSGLKESIAFIVAIMLYGGTCDLLSHTLR